MNCITCLVATKNKTYQWSLIKLLGSSRLVIKPFLKRNLINSYRYNTEFKVIRFNMTNL